MGTRPRFTTRTISKTLSILRLRWPVNESCERQHRTELERNLTSFLIHQIDGLPWSLRGRSSRSRHRRPFGLGTEIVTSEMLLRSQRKLHHAFQELVRRQADEVVHDELLGVEADEVAQLQRLAARGIDEIPVPVVDHHYVALCISARAPGLSRHKQRRAGAP